ncbi:L-fuco-beta-pyranose dehydrogenase [Minicystis rosea]|nr:L-fuco-beta-pyranose dehydrogenase [Minicystis rosea]
MLRRPMKGAPFTPAEIEAAIKVLEAIAGDRGALAHVEPRDARLRLLEAAGRVSLPNRAEQRKLAKAFRRKQADEVKAADDALLDATGIRALRRAPVFATPEPQALVEGRPRPGALSSGLPSPGGAPPAEEDGPEVKEPRKCYVCKASFTRLHFFYDQMCPSCAALNWEKRNQTADLSGRVAIVTGARVKIGYQAAILLLRAGARVIVTTRFPHDAAARYAREPDFPVWADRLAIHGLDLRLTPAVERFTRTIDEQYDRLDFIIHNACQTVRRPPGFYAHLVDHERAALDALPPEVRPLLQSHHDDRRARRGVNDDPALLSQAALTAEDRALAGRVDLFPAGELDADLQQIDLRPQNSWRLTLAEVPTVELLEVQLVNAVAPFVMSSKLKPLMLRHRTMDKHIVNVSAMEGQFYRDHKTDKHPHTNMAKAALNMLTRTSAADYVQDGIHMNSVDTGWVSDEDPATLAARKREVHRFHPPLDIVDGAARIVDPIFSGMLTGKHVWGQFLKDYMPTDW